MVEEGGKMLLVMKIDGPTNPFHISRAYGVRLPARAIEPLRVGPAPAASVEVNNASRLVAASVPGRVDFSGDVPRPSDSAAIPMYRHPADRNAAATAVTAGRTIDVRG